MTGDIFDILDDLDKATDYTRSFEPSTIPDGTSTNEEKRTWLLKEFKRARKVGMGISTVQILRCIRSTVSPARVWELQQEGWDIVNHGKCVDGSDLYALMADEKGKPMQKLLGWEGSLSTTGLKTKAHAHHQALTPEEQARLDLYMQGCLRGWVAANKPGWAKLCP